MRKALTTLVIGALAIALTGCGGNKGIKLGAKHKVGDDATYSIEGADQTSGGKTVKVPEVYLKQKGYVAIHSDQGGAPGPVLGVSELLNAGEVKDVKIKLKTPLKTSANVFPMVHIEDNGNTTYDFPNGDAPAPLASGGVVVVKIRITVR